MGSFRGPLAAWLILVAVCVLAVACVPDAYVFHGEHYQTRQAAADLLLTDQDSRPFSLSTQHGKVVVIYFGYTACPDTCPITLAQLAQVWVGLGQENARRFQPIFVSVDPERDSAEVLARYLHPFDAAVGDDLGLGFIGLRGTPDELAPLLEAYQVLVEKRAQPGSAAGYVMEHTASSYLVDANGNLIARFPYGTSVPDILADVRHLLREGDGS
jgi:protein SCO1/2